MLTIYSLGDPWYLGKVMDAIAMISGSKSGFVGASEIAALIGVFIVGFQAILRLQINIHHLLVCYIVYMGCFSVTTDVSIESVYSDKTVIQKDNVPFGPAVLGSVISQIGYGLTKKMEVAFSDIDEAKMTNGKANGYLNPLYVLNNLANWSENGELLDYMLNTPQGRNLSRNYILYVADCTTKAVFLGRQWGGKTWNDVFSQSFGNDIKFKSDLYGTEFINSSDQAEVLSCTEGYDKLMEQINLALTQVLGDSKKAQNILNKIGQCQGGSCQETLGLTSPIETIEQALEALNQGSVDAHKFMLNGMLENLKKTGLAAGFKHYRDVNTANMLYQSIQQRNLQWASEGNIFLNAMRPMMAFIEGFFYAISPFAAIIMLLGLFGLNIFFKYIMLLLWIQLWTPIMAIANLFIITSAKQALNPLTLTDTAAEDGGAISTYYYETIVQVCQDKIAVGSMMLAATPVLSLMIISGSIYAFTSLTNRIAGADHFNEKVLTPDIASAAPVMNHQAMFNSDNYGFTKTGALDDNINLSEGLKNAALSTESSMLTKSNQVQTQISHAFNMLGSNSSGYTNVSAFDHLTSSNKGVDLQNATQTVQQWATQKGIKLDKQEASHVALGLSANVAGMSFSAAERHGFSKNEYDAIQKLDQESDAISKIQKAGITSNISASLSEGFKKDNSYTESGGISKSLNESASDLRSKTAQFQKAYSYSKEIGSGANYQWKQVVDQAVTNLGYHNIAWMLQNKIQSLSDYQKPLFDAEVRNNQRIIGNIGSNSELIHQLRALKKVDDSGTAILVAEMMNKGTGVGHEVEDLTSTYSKATTNTVPEATGVDAVQLQAIKKQTQATMGTNKEISESSDPHTSHMGWQAIVEGDADTTLSTINNTNTQNMKQSMVEKYRANGMFKKGAIKEVSVSDAINLNTALKTGESFVSNVIDSVAKSDIPSDNKKDYNTLLTEGIRQTKGEFNPLINSQNEDLVLAVQKAFVAGQLQLASTNGFKVASNSIRDMKQGASPLETIGNSLYNTVRNTNNYQTAINELRTTAINYAQNKLGVNAEESIAFAENYINLTNAAVKTGDHNKEGALYTTLATR